jgi:hypothetical protein
VQPDERSRLIHRWAEHPCLGLTGLSPAKDSRRRDYGFTSVLDTASDGGTVSSEVRVVGGWPARRSTATESR